MINKGIFKLSDIISWDNSGNWESWSLPELTDRDPILHAQQKTLLKLIMGWIQFTHLVKIRGVGDQ